MSAGSGITDVLTWNTNITQLLGSKGLMGYIDGSIMRPSQPSSDTPTPEPTPIYLGNPNYDEWNHCDKFTRGHITLNCTDVAGLGVMASGMAKEAWDSIQAEWGRSMDMRRSHAQEELNCTVYIEGTSIQDHVKLLRTRKAAVDNLSTTPMDDETWRGIVIRSIPPTPRWLLVIPSLYAMTSPPDIFSTLNAHGMILERGSHGKPTSGSSNTVLAARLGVREPCANPKCKAKKWSSHRTEDCYWEGRGKEGQFLPNFGQRARASATRSPKVGEHFVLSSRIPDTPGLSGVILEVNGMADEDTHMTALVSKRFQDFREGAIPTFLNSGASDTMFVARDAFMTYQKTTPCSGDSAKAINGDFEIIGEGTVVKKYFIHGKARTITYT
jgi:hypothetical protein